MTFTTTIKKEWWDRKMEQYKAKGHFYEYKRYKEYWNLRIKNNPPEIK